MVVETGVIFGIDIAKGSSRSKELPRYAVAVLKGGRLPTIQWCAFLVY